MENNSQENTVEPNEPIETAIDINSLSLETKDDDINNFSSETKDDILSRTKQHRESIDKIIVPQYFRYIDDQYIEDNYAVTYSEKDKSFLGWTINTRQNGQQHPDVYFKLDQSYIIHLFKLCKKTLLFCYYENSFYRKYLFDTKI
jgi:hypothetical protein